MRIVDLDRLKRALFEADAVTTQGLEIIESFPLESAVSEEYYVARLAEEQNKNENLSKTIAEQHKTIRALTGAKMVNSLKTSCENCKWKSDANPNANPYELMATCDNKNVRSIDLHGDYFRCSEYEQKEVNA